MGLQPCWSHTAVLGCCAVQLLLSIPAAADFCLPAGCITAVPYSVCKCQPACSGPRAVQPGTLHAVAQAPDQGHPRLSAGSGLRHCSLLAPWPRCAASDLPVCCWRLGVLLESCQGASPCLAESQQVRRLHVEGAPWHSQKCLPPWSPMLIDLEQAPVTALHQAGNALAGRLAVTLGLCCRCSCTWSDPLWHPQAVPGAATSQHAARCGAQCNHAGHAGSY